MASRLLGPDPELVELPHGVGLQVDAHAERLEVSHRLQHDARHADLMQCQGDAQPPDAAAGDENGQTIPGLCLWSSCHFAGRQHAACLEGTHKDIESLTVLYHHRRARGFPLCIAG